MEVNVKNNNKIFIIMIIVLIFSISGCSESEKKDEYQKSVEGGNNGQNEQDVPGRYSAQGRIVKIDEDGLHVEYENKVDVYKVDKARSSNYFIGEYVGINKLDGDQYDAVSDQYFDYNLRKTATGETIRRVTATVGDVDGDFVSAVTEMGDLKFNNPGNFSLKAGDPFMVDYIEGEGVNQLLSYYDESSKINATVMEISRDTSGMLRIFATSDDNREYDIQADADTITNFAHSTLKEGDEILVYPEKISGDIPAYVDAKLIVRQDNLD